MKVFLQNIYGKLPIKYFFKKKTQVIFCDFFQYFCTITLILKENRVAMSYSILLITYQRKRYKRLSNSMSKDFKKPKKTFSKFSTFFYTTLS